MSGVHLLKAFRLKFNLEGWVDITQQWKGRESCPGRRKKTTVSKDTVTPQSIIYCFLYFGGGDKYLSVAEIRSEKLEVTGGKDRERGRARALWAWYARLRPVDCLVGNKELYKKVGSRGGMWSILHFRWITPVAVVWGYCNVQARDMKAKRKGMHPEMTWLFVLIFPIELIS